MRRVKLGLLAIFMTAMSACDDVAVIHPHHGPMVAGGMPHRCVEIRDPALRARVLTRLEPQFRGPMSGGSRVTLREHLRKHRHHVFDCGDVWRVMFISSDVRMTPNYLILRKDGVILHQPY
jgi:hypothetical protein